MILRLAASFALVATLMVSALASAQSLIDPDQQPEYRPRRVLVMPTLRMSDDALTSPTTEAARELVSDIESWLNRNPRVELVRWDDLLATRSAADALTVEQLRLGRRLYRAGDLEAAEEELSEGLQTASVSLLPWRERQAMIASYEALFLLQLERATTTENGAELRRRENLARGAMRNLLRLNPSYQVEPARFPQRMVELFQIERDTMSEELLVARPHRPDALARIAEQAAADVVVETVIVQRGDTLTVRLLMSYGDPLSVEVDESIEHDMAQLGSDVGEELASFAIDSVEAELVCMPPAPLPEPEQPEQRPVDVWLEAAYFAGVYVSSPTRARFLNHGVAFRMLVQFHEYVGIHASLHSLFSSEDRFGDLLDRVSTVQVGLGTSFSYTTGRFRVFFEPGLSFTQIGRVKATEEFWCKVSDGDEVVFDANGRECTPDDITETAPQAYFGIQLDGGVGVRVASPLWVMARLHSVLFLAPVEGRSVDFPLGGEVGFALQF